MKKFMFLVCLCMLWTVTNTNSGTISTYWVPPTYKEIDYKQAPFPYKKRPSISPVAVMRPLTDPLELECMSKNIYFEAAMESTAGKLAVAQVTLNRVKSKHYPNSVCEVVYEGPHYASGHPKRDRCQFSWYCDGKHDTPSVGGRMWGQSQQVAKYVLENKELLDITDGATHYHADYIENPRWAIARHKTMQIDTHIFYNKNKKHRL